MNAMQEKYDVGSLKICENFPGRLISKITGSAFRKHKVKSSLENQWKCIIP